MSDLYDPGQIIYPVFTFAVPSGFPPPVTVNVTAVIQNPDGVEANLPLGAVVIAGQMATVQASPGFIIPDTNASNKWWVARAKATGDIVDTHEYRFFVRRSAVLA